VVRIRIPEIITTTFHQPLPPVRPPRPLFPPLKTLGARQPLITTSATHNPYKSHVASLSSTPTAANDNRDPSLIFHQRQPSPKSRDRHTFHCRSQPLVPDCKTHNLPGRTARASSIVWTATTITVPHQMEPSRFRRFKLLIKRRLLRPRAWATPPHRLIAGQAHRPHPSNNSPTQTPPQNSAPLPQKPLSSDDSVVRGDAREAPGPRRRVLL
jgi:hypothetical protein